MDNIRGHFPEIQIGPFRVIPQWEISESENDEMDIIIAPSMAFGTGHHGTTNLCLRHLALWIPKIIQPNVWDLGTGSGILAIAATKLGAKVQLCQDHDPVALDVFETHARINNCSALAFTTSWPTKNEVKKISLLLVNIVWSGLKEVLPRAIPMISPKAHLIISGFETENRDELTKLLYELNCEILEEGESQPWRSMVARRM